MEEVSSFKYLGASFTATGQAFGKIKARINSARAAINRLQPSLWSRPKISRRTKRRIYESVARTILLYGCETWPPRVEDQRCLEGFDNDCIRRILRRLSVTASRAKLYAIALTSAPSRQFSCNAGSDGSDTLLAVLPAKSSATSSTRCRLRTGAGSEVFN